MSQPELSKVELENIKLKYMDLMQTYVRHLNDIRTNLRYAHTIEAGESLAFMNGCIGELADMMEELAGFSAEDSEEFWRELILR